MLKRRVAAETMETYPEEQDGVMEHMQSPTEENDHHHAQHHHHVPVGHEIVDPDDLADEVPLVKKRRTKNYKWREDLAKKRGKIVLRVPPLDPLTFDTWEQFISAWTEYMAQTKTLYRRRSSCTTTSWNSKNRFKKYPVPDSFQYATMAYWCTHGCIQQSRGTGVRAHLHNRFTGCTARITADVVYEKRGETDVHWFIRVRNQISQHNHRISDEIYSCYANNSSVPDELLFGPPNEVKLQSSPSSIARNFESVDSDFAASGRLVTDLDHHVDVDQESGKIALRTGVTNATKLHGDPSVGTGIKEVLADQKNLNMANAELEPLLNELKRTPSRVIHKRLQDVSEAVEHLLAKWNRDRAVEEQSYPHSFATIPNRIAGNSFGEQQVPASPVVAVISNSSAYTAGDATISQRMGQYHNEVGRVDSTSSSTNGRSSETTSNHDSRNGTTGRVDDDGIIKQRDQTEVV